MEAPKSPSPTPSMDDFYGVPPTMSFAGNTSYPPSSLVYDGIHPYYSHHQSRYSTPAPEDDFLSYGSSPGYPGPSPGLSIASYTSDYPTLTRAYGASSRNINNLSRAPYTPETSPPTPGHTSHATPMRSGLSTLKKPPITKVSKVKGGRVQRKKRAQTSHDGSNVLTKPLSEVAKDVPEVPVADIAGFVTRSTEERLKETSRNKTPGRIKRPMNAFMLYRKAYQEVAKTQCSHNNHQHVSKVCGAGWPMEPDHIHHMFNEWAQIERANHQKAHPDYKFAPSKSKKGKPNGADDGPSTGFSDADDPDWASTHGLGRRGPRQRVPLNNVLPLDEIQVPSYERYSSVDSLGPPFVHTDPQQDYQYVHPPPGRPFALQYNQLENEHHFEQDIPAEFSTMRYMHDGLPRTPSPAVQFPLVKVDSSPVQVETFHQRQESALESSLDPSLVVNTQYGFMDEFSRESSLELQGVWQPSYDDGHSWIATDAPYDFEDSHDTYLRGKQGAWQVQELEDGGHFDQWYIQGEEDPV